MAHESTVYGYIQGITWKLEAYRQFQSKNLEIIAALPVEDEWPPLVAGMFSAPDRDPLRGTFRTQVIHFGASMNDLQFGEIGKWVRKLEGLLRTMYWFSARAHVETELDGRYEISWKTTLNYYDIGREGREPPPTLTWKRKVLNNGAPLASDALYGRCGL